MDVRGRLIRELAVGAGSLGWDGRDALGRPVGRGLYVLRIRTAATGLQRSFALVE
jgi:hypothetical protein